MPIHWSFLYSGLYGGGASYKQKKNILIGENNTRETTCEVTTFLHIFANGSFEKIFYLLLMMSALRNFISIKIFIIQETI